LCFLPECSWGIAVGLYLSGERLEYSTPRRLEPPCTMPWPRQRLGQPAKPPRRDGAQRSQGSVRPGGLATPLARADLSRHRLWRRRMDQNRMEPVAGTRFGDSVMCYASSGSNQRSRGVHSDNREYHRPQAVHVHRPPTSEVPPQSRQSELLFL
jgi:hypothetical protein